MSLTARQLNRASLARQMLLRRERLSLLDAVRRLVALQAQEPASPYLALWNRLARFDPAELDQAFAERTIVKASLIRLTLHAVQAEDYPPFYSAMLAPLRESRLTDGRFTKSGLTIPAVDAVLPDLLKFAAQPRSKGDIEALLKAQVGAAKPAWFALKRYAPLHHAPTGGPWSFGAAPSYVAARPKPRRLSPDGAVQMLLLRYLAAFGPASLRDFGQFTVLRRPVTVPALRALGNRVVEVEGPGGATLFDVAEGVLPAEDTPAPPRLLPMWDSVLLAYADRGRVIPPDYRRLVIHQNGDVLPTLLVDGYVAGVWRPVEGGIEATAFHKLSGDAWEGLAAEAMALVTFLAGRDLTVYRRYNHWWATLPSAERLVLPG
jgi:winged helix DNA-binding protein